MALWFEESDKQVWHLMRRFGPMDYHAVCGWVAPFANRWADWPQKGSQARSTAAAGCRACVGKE